MSNRLILWTFYEDDMLIILFITKVAFFRGKEEEWGEEGLNGVNILPPPPHPLLHCLWIMCNIKIQNKKSFKAAIK